MKISLSLLSTLLMTTGTQAVSTIAFDCKTIPNVCENMCWGTKCTEKQGELSKLNFDAQPAKSAVVSKRRNMAGCGSYNRCSNSKNAKAPWGQANYNCDEFPFASTTQGGERSLPHVNRCVPNKENSSQGSQLQKFFGKEFPKASRAGCQTTPGNCQFEIAFQYGKKSGAAPANSFCRAGPNDQSVKATCSNVSKFFSSPLMPNIQRKDDQEHKGTKDANGKVLVSANPTKWKRAVTDLWERAGTLAPAIWKRGGSDDGNSDAGTSDAGSATSKGSKGSKGSTDTTGTTSSGSGGSTASSDEGHQYELTNGYYIYSVSTLAKGSKVYVMEYDATACTGGIQAYLEESDTNTYEMILENIEVVDEENEKCWQMLETTVAKEVV